MNSQDLQSTALATADNTLARPLRPVAAIESILESQNAVAEVIAKALQENRDYGKIPGTQKPTLLKPGAERICNAFGVYSDCEIFEKEVDHVLEFEWEKQKKIYNNAYEGDRSYSLGVERGKSIGLYRYVVKCRMILRTNGETVGTGFGSASSMESKYIDRPRDIENTVLKMAKKRAIIDACLNTFSLSDRFTQDEEDKEEREAAKVQRNTARDVKAKTEDKKEKPATGVSAIITKYGLNEDQGKKLIGFTPRPDMQDVEKLFEQARAKDIDPLRYLNAFDKWDELKAGIEKDLAAKDANEPKPNLQT